MNAKCFGLVALFALSLGCNTFGDVNETDISNNATSNNSNSNNVASNNSVSNNTASNNTTSNNTASNNASNNSSNNLNTNNQTNDANGGRHVVVGCARRGVVGAQYPSLSPQNGGFTGDPTCTLGEARRFTTGPLPVEMGDVSDVSLVSNGAAFFGLWSAGDGLVGKVSYDVRTPEAPAFDTSAVVQARELVLARSENELLIVQLQVDGTLKSNALSGDVDDNSSGLSYAGGHNPFNDTNTDVVVTLFLGTMSSSYDAQLLELPVSRTYPLEYDAAPMESTSGTLNAYREIDGLILAQHVREPLTPFAVASDQKPGKWAFVHLADEHYVLAVPTSDGIELQRLALIDGVSGLELSGGPTITLDVGSVNFLELAAFEGGFALFYDQGIGNDRTWTIVPVRVETFEADIEVFSCQPGMAFDYAAAVAYKDVDMAALRQGCDLHVGILTSFDVGGAQFTHLEGAQFRGFYAE